MCSRYASTPSPDILPRRQKHGKWAVIGLRFERPSGRLELQSTDAHGRQEGARTTNSALGGHCSACLSVALQTVDRAVISQTEKGGKTAHASKVGSETSVSSMIIVSNTSSLCVRANAEAIERFNRIEAATRSCASCARSRPRLSAEMAIENLKAMNRILKQVNRNRPTSSGCL